MDAVSIINRLSRTTKRTEKEQILMDAFMKGHREFFIGAQLCYDILTTFGVQKVGEITDEDDGDAGTLSFSDFLDLANKLRTRKLTGYAARDAILDAADKCHIPTWNVFYRRVLLKDLKAGIDVKTINKVLQKLAPTQDDAKKYIIPVFSCQLAHDGMKPEYQKKLSGPKMLDLKLDGVRLLTILDKEEGTITQYTRNGKINTNFSDIRESLIGIMNMLPGSVVLDGEVISSSFQDLMKQINRKDNIDTSSSKLAIFDIIPLSAFKEGICKTSQEQRHEIISNLETTGLLREHTKGLVYVIPKKYVNLSTDEGKESFQEFNKMAIEQGYEGIMVKDPNAPYELKRSFAWLKIKPFIDVSLAVVGVEEGTGKYEGMLGAFICEGDDDGKNIKVNCGSGFSDEDRKDIWKNRDRMIGMIVEIRADALSLEEGSDVWSLRFPRFKGFRGTVPNEKL